MSKPFALALLAAYLAASGCGHDATTAAEEASTPRQSLPSAPLSYDYAGPSGIMVSFDTDAPRHFSAADCEHAYQQVSACMNLRSPGPVVRVVKSPIVVNGREYSGYTDFSTGQITLVSCSVAPHEFVHYLLWATQFPNAQNANHVSDGFTRCGTPLTAPTAS